MISKVSHIKYGNDVGSVARIAIHAIFVIYSICCIYPVIVMISSSLSNETSIYKSGYSIFPKEFTLLAYKVSLINPEIIGRSYLVTFTVTVFGTLLGLWLVASLGYVLSRKGFVLRKVLSFYVFFTMLFYGGLVPYYILIVKWLGLKNSILALVAPGLVSAWYVLLMKGFFSGIPESIPESAKIDGAGELAIFARIILPISKPSLATVGLFLTLQYWNDWFNCLLFIENEKLYTLQYMLIKMVQSMEFLNANLSKIINTVSVDHLDMPSLTARFAMCVLATGPMLFVFMFFQKYFVKGLTVGSVKG